MTKQETYDFLKNKGIEFEVTEHRAVFTMNDDMGVDLPYPESDAKNLFIRDDKRRNYYLITVKGDKRVDLKEFKNAHGTRKLTFASAEDMFEMMKLTPGSVTPFGLLSDEERKIIFYLDEDFFEGDKMIGCHPNENTATVWLKIKDMVDIIEEHGNEINVVKL